MIFRVMANWNSICGSQACPEKSETEEYISNQVFQSFLRETFYYYCIQRKNRMKSRLRTCFLAVRSTVEITKFCVSACCTLRGPWCRERSVAPSHQRSVFVPDVHVLSAEIPRSGMLLQNVLMNQSSLVLPQVLWGLG